MNTQATPPPVHVHADQPPCVYPWIPDQGDGAYRNPVICADYSDPDVVRDGDDYYLTASSFNCTPGLPILHSRDLVNWTIIGHALKNVPDPRYEQVQHGAGVWAPAIRKHDGKFWIFFPTPDEGIYIVTAVNPAGPWSQPHLLLAGKGLIDPCPLWDDDGKAYLVHAYAGSRAGIKDRLHVRPMAPDASHMLGPGQVVFMDPERHPTLEGPKFHKRDGWYYISAPAGGVRAGWQVILRSRHVYGQYEDKIVLAQRSTPINGPHQGAIIDTAGGKWWFLHFQDAAVYGRIVHLQPVEWRDGWPIMGVNHDAQGVGQPVLKHVKPIITPTVAVPRTSDEFTAPHLGLQWQWHANHRGDWASLSARPGFLRLAALPSDNGLDQTPHLLLQKLPARSFTVETTVELAPGDAPMRAGLIVMGLTHAALALERGPDGLRLVFIRDNEVVDTVALSAPAVRLRITMGNGGRCRFSFAADASHLTDVGPPFTAQEGRWIGAKVGLFARGCPGAQPQPHADFDYFRFSAPGPDE